MDRQLKLAWAAGFFDGEGYVGTSKRSSKYKDKVYESLYTNGNAGGNHSLLSNASRWKIALIHSHNKMEITKLRG